MELPWLAALRRPKIDYEKLEQGLQKLLERNAIEDRRYQFTLVNKMLKDELGVWTRAWCWGEIDGGPVSAWCCYDHSFLAGKPTEEPSLTVDRVLAGLKDWEATIRDCQSLFARLIISEPIDIDIAILEVVNFVVEKTGASDAWYNFCSLVLSWYLQSLGIPQTRAEKYTHKALSGHFESWSAPSETVKEQVAESFRDSLWRKLFGS